MIKALQVFLIVSRRGGIVQRIRCCHTFRNGIPTTFTMERYNFQAINKPRVALEGSQALQP